MTKSQNYSVVLGYRDVISNGSHRDKAVRYFLSNYYLQKIYPYPPKDHPLRPLLSLARFFYFTYPRIKPMIIKENEMSYYLKYSYLDYEPPEKAYQRFRIFHGDDYNYFKEKRGYIRRLRLKYEHEWSHRTQLIKDKHERNYNFKTFEL